VFFLKVRKEMKKRTSFFLLIKYNFFVGILSALYFLGDLVSKNISNPRRPSAAADFKTLHIYIALLLY